MPNVWPLKSSKTYLNVTQNQETVAQYCWQIHVYLVILPTLSNICWRYFSHMTSYGEKVKEAAFLLEVVFFSGLCKCHRIKLVIATAVTSTLCDYKSRPGLTMWHYMYIYMECIIDNGYCIKQIWANIRVATPANQWNRIQEDAKIKLWNL